MHQVVHIKSFLMREEKFLEFIHNQFNITDCSQANLPDQYLNTASVYITNIAHAYSYSVRAIRGTQDTIIKFPDNIEIPWQQISKRIGRSSPRMLLYDFASFNVLEKSSDGDLDLFFSIFDTNTHFKFSITFALTEKMIGQAVPPIYSIVSNYNSNIEIIENELLKMFEPLHQATKTMRRLICTSRFDAENYVNPILWTKTTAIMFQSTRKDEIGLSGGAAPIFSLLDHFFGRKLFQSSLGKQLQEKEFLPEHSDFIATVAENSKKTLSCILSVASTRHLFYQLSQLYYGSHGYLGIHQKKVYGFMLVGIASGRGSTNAGTLQGANHAAVNQLDDEFTQANLERNLELQSGRALKVTLKRAINFAENAKYITFDMSGKLFKIWPGDKIAILPQNNSYIVEKCQVIIYFLYPNLNVDYNQKWKEFIIKQGLIKESSIQSKLNFILRFGQIVNLKQSQDILGIKSLPSSSFFDILSHIYSNSKTLPPPDLSSLLDIIDPMNYRYYSICSSPKELDKSSEISILCGLLEYKEQTGVCSSFLHSEELYFQNEVNVKIVYSYWSVPTKEPLLIIAGGTGISPMMSLLKHRIDLGYFNNFVFFATTDKNHFYFEKNFEEYVKHNYISFFGTFTRSSDPNLKFENSIIRTNISIKALLESQALLISNLLEKNVYIYTCGRTGFCKIAYDTILQIMLREENKDNPENQTNLSNMKLIEMKYQGRYVEEAFTTHNTLHAKDISILDVLSNDNYFFMSNSVYDVSEFKKNTSRR
jgi:NAD(P)H-flavin reductase